NGDHASSPKCLLCWDPLRAEIRVIFIAAMDEVKLRHTQTVWCLLAARPESPQVNSNFRNKLMQHVNGGQLLATVLLLIAALSALPVEVSAHARVKRANPAIGGVLLAAGVPTQLQVWLPEKLGPALSTHEGAGEA